MRRIERTKSFRRDYKRVRGSPKHKSAVVILLPDLIGRLAEDRPLPPSHRDHALTGNWSGYRECHVKPDLLLIYRKVPENLLLVRLGSHSELFDD